MSRCPRNFVLAVLLVLVTACRGNGNPQPPRAPILDLIADLDLVEIEREPGLVDLGDPAARALLRNGWGLDETGGDRTFVWSDGPESELEFFLASPRDVPLSLRGEPYRASGAPAQEVSLVLNGHAVGRMVAAAGGEESRLVLPGRSLRAGANRLVLRYAWTRSPWEDTAGRSADRRRLAVAWDLLRFETGVDETARVRAAGDRLAIPFGWRIAAYLRLPAGAALSLAELRSRDGDPGELRVSLRRERGEDREIVRLRPGEGPATLELENVREEVVRISLSAVPETPDGRPGRGLVLRRPVLVAPAIAERRASQAPAAPTVAPAALRQPPPAGRPRNVIVYLVDTLRADHLGCYGYARPVSPRIDAFAGEATRFRHAVAQSSWTRPTVATILTGLLPRTHDVHGRRDALSQEAVTLAEILKERGYRTAGFVTNGNVARSFGLAQGFETYRLLPGKSNSAAEVNAKAAEWLDGRRGDAPFFLYLHTVEPHGPYSPPAPFRQRFAAGVRDEDLTRRRTLRRLREGTLQPTPQLRRDLLDLYDGEIAANDAAFGELMDSLVRRGLWEETVVVFLSDHGEEFLDHGSWEHGATLHAEMLEVPLIVRVPGMGAGKAVERLAQHVDVVPTILAALDLPVPAAVEGRSLLPWIAGDRPAAEIDAEEAAFSWLDQREFRSAAVTTPSWRLIENQAPVSGRLLYDRRADPAERNNLVSARPVRSGYLRARLRAEERSREGSLQAGQGTADEEVRKQLQALGYVN